MKTDDDMVKWTVTIPYAAAARILPRFNLRDASVALFSAVSNWLVKILFTYN